jgi:alkaline phosphatase D
LTTVNAWSGGVTSSTARVSVKATGTGDVRIVVATNADLSNAEYFGPVATVNSAGIVDLAGLPAVTDHWYGVEDAGVLDTSWIGTFRTAGQVGQPESFAFAVAGDAGATPQYPGQGAVLVPNRLSNHPVFATIATHPKTPRFFVNLGDWAYYDPGSGVYVPDASEATYHRLIDDNLLQPNQQLLAKAMPWSYIWDDHDFGPNDSDRTAPGRDNACRVHRLRVPSFALPAGTGAQPVYQSWQRGRVLFILSDTRSDRSPSSDPDTAAKTMLGTAQKSWMRNVLETSDAEFLVWLNPTPWLGTIPDSWSGGYTVERDEIAQMLTDTGWATQMWCITADSHALGLCSAAANPHGHFPIFQAAGLDATPSTGSGSQYDLGWLPGRNQYGIVDVADTGDFITVTATGYVGTIPWRSHAVTVDLTEPPPAAPPSVAHAEIRTRVTWLACQFESGDVIAELPDVQGPTSRVLGAYTSTELRVPIPLSGPGHVPIDLLESATTPRRTMLVQVVHDVPSWGGIPMIRRGGTDADLVLGCVSVEGYLEHVYVGDHAWTAHDEVSVIGAGLAAEANKAGGNFIIDAVPTGRLRNRGYRDRDDVSLYRALRELMAVRDGPEWTVDLDWVTAERRAVAKIIRIRPRIGTASPTPNPVFTVTAASVFGSRAASEATYTLVEDHTDGRAADYVIATGIGEGAARPQSTPAVGTPAGKARWERRFTPTSSTPLTVADLDAHAAAELARLAGGSVTWQVLSRWDASPRLNVDWLLGDDAGLDLIGHRHPNRIQTQARVIGWELDTRDGRVRPILLQPGPDIRPIDEEKLVKTGTVTGTPNSSGYLTVTHNSGFVPAIVTLEGESPISGGNSPYQHMVDGIDETKFRSRWFDASGAVITTQITFRWLAVEG